MKKILSFVLLAAMLVSLIVPASLAADAGASVVAESTTVMDDGNKTDLATAVKLAVNPGAFEAVDTYVFWNDAAATVSGVSVAFNEELIDADSSGKSNVLNSKNKAFANAIKPYIGDGNIADYKGVQVSFVAFAATDGVVDLGTVNFTLKNACAPGSAFNFSVITTDFNYGEGECSAEKADASITVVKDPNMGKYENFTLFAVTDSETIVPGTKQVRVEVRFDANPGLWGGSFLLVYPKSWTAVTSGEESEDGAPLPKFDCGNIYKKSDLTIAPEADSEESYAKYSVTRDCFDSFPEISYVGTNIIAVLFMLDDPNGVTYKNGILGTFYFNVPEDMKIGDSAPFYFVYDRNGGIFCNGPSGEPNDFIFLTPDTYGLTFKMECSHDATHEEIVKDADCGNDGSKNIVCDACGTVVDTVVIPATGAHKFETTTVDATCTEDGSTHKECTVCHQKTDVEVIPALGHNMELKETVAPTCKEGGYDLYECTRCHETEKRNETAAVPHTPGTPVVTEATCTEDGKSVTKCTVCGDVLEETVLNALGHDWDEGVVTAPTCDAEGYTTKTCGRCGETEIVDRKDMLGHSMKETSRTPASCTEDGKVVYTCENGCGKTETEVLKAFGHAMDDGVVTKEPTCTAAGVKTYTCTHNCGYTTTEEIAATGHDWNEGTVTTAPTCTKEGVKTFECKNGCGETKTEAVAATGHKWDEGTVTTAPTCTEKGAKEFKCTAAGCTETKTEEVAALGHTWDEGKVTKEATEKETGVKTYTCTVCGETKEETIPVVVPEKKPETDNKGTTPSTGTEDKKPAKTGDNMMYIVIALAVVALGATTVVVIRKRKEN